MIPISSTRLSQKPLSKGLPYADHVDSKRDDASCAKCPVCRTPLMCLLLIPLTLSINYSSYLQRQVDYQEALKIAKDDATTVNSIVLEPPKPTVEISKLFLKPMPLSVFANGMEESLPSYLGMTRNGITLGIPALVSAPFSYILGQLDLLFVISNVFSLLALLFTFDAVAGEKEVGTIRVTLANALPRDIFYGVS